MIRTSDLTFAKNVLGSWSKILQDGKSPDDPHAYNYEYQTPQYQEGEIASVVAYIFDFFNDPNAGDYYLALICFYEKVGREYKHKVLYRYCYRPEDLDEFKKMVGDFASDQQMRLNQAMQFELDEDDPVPDREDSYDQILQELNSGRIANRAIAGKHSGDSDVSIYMKKLKNCLAGYWDDVQYLEDYYDGTDTHEEIIFLDDENGDTHSVELEFEYEDIEDGDPCFLVCPFEEYMWAFEVDATLDPLMDARSITKALNDEIRSLN